MKERRPNQQPGADCADADEVAPFGTGIDIFSISVPAHERDINLSMPVPAPYKVPDIGTFCGAE